MTAPLNGLLLNGGTPYATWAWGMSQIEATATAEPAVYGVYRFVDGEMLCESVSSGITDRLAFLNGEEQPYADTAMVATRHAYFDAQTVASVDASIVPVRMAWFDAPSLQTDAQSAAYAERWKIFAAEASAWAQTNGVENRVYRWSFSKYIPAQARSWAAESLIHRIRVRQVYAKSDAVVRARSRALANTALGFGQMAPVVQTWADNLKVNTYHAYRGSTLADCVLLVDSSRIRIIVGGMPGEAFARAAPTITTATGRYSYNSGFTSASAYSTTTNKVLRGLYPASTVAVSEALPANTFLVRGLRGLQAARAETFAVPGSFTRVPVSRQTAIATATTGGEFNRYRWSPIVPLPVVATAQSNSTNSVAAYANEAVFVCYVTTTAAYAVERWQFATTLAEATAFGVAVRWAGLGGRANGVANAPGDNLRTAYLNGSAVGESLYDSVAVRNAYVDGAIESVAEATSVADRTAWMGHETVGAWAEAVGDNMRLTFAENHRDTAVSSVAISANIYTMRYWGEQVLEASAEGWGDPWRITMALPISDDATAVVMRFVFRINIDSLAPVRRTIVLTPAERQLAIPASTREYRVA